MKKDSHGLYPCPKCHCDDLETSPYEVDRRGRWGIICGGCGFYLESGDKDLLCSAWNSLVNQSAKQCVTMESDWLTRQLESWK